MAAECELRLHKRLMELSYPALLPITRQAHVEPVSPPARTDEQRFAMQHEAIGRAMQRTGLTGRSAAQPCSTTLVEFGAGGGQLSQALWSDRAGMGQLDFLLIDKNNKRKTKHVTKPGFAPQRLEVDVQEFRPEALRQRVPGRCIALSNHMCGCALDIALRCAVSAFPGAGGGGGGGGGGGLAGVVAVSCCHHKCTWESYLGREFFRSLGLGSADFDLVRRWSAAAPRRNKPSATRERVVRLAETLGISPDEAAALGARCRQLLDTGRARALEQRGYAVSLEQHVDFSVTADHVMLLACQPADPAGQQAVQAEAAAQAHGSAGARGADRVVQPDEHA